MTSLNVRLIPVAFRLENGPAEFVGLVGEHGEFLEARAGSDPDRAVRSLLTKTIERLTSSSLADAPRAAISELEDVLIRRLALVGAETDSGDTVLLYSTAVPLPLADTGLDILSGSPFSWLTISTSSRKRRTEKPEMRTGSTAIVLDYWRQGFEETDVCLDFLPKHLSLLQLRSLYDAIWGYDQDPSGFKRWAIDRKGAFGGLLEKIEDPTEIDEVFYNTLGQHVPREAAVKAGALAGGALTGGALASTAALGGLALPVGMAAATAAVRLYSRRGPEPTWYRKTKAWQEGPTWIRNVYPPRPAWTRWDVGAQAPDDR